MWEFVPPKSSFIKQNEKFNKCIKYNFYNNLSGKPKTINYGVTFNIEYDGFWFRIVMGNFKIDIRKDFEYIKDEIIQEKLLEIINIIERYYPNLYEEKYKNGFRNHL